jgi:hypothetical protein
LPTGFYDYIIKRTLHGGFKIWILFSSGESNTLATAHRRVISSIYWGSSEMLGTERKTNVEQEEQACEILYSKKKLLLKFVLKEN